MDFIKPIRCLICDLNNLDDEAQVLICGQIIKKEIFDKLIVYLLNDNTGQAEINATSVQLQVNQYVKIMGYYWKKPYHENQMFNKLNINKYEILPSSNEMRLFQLEIFAEKAFLQTQQTQQDNKKPVLIEHQQLQDVNLFAELGQQIMLHMLKIQKICSYFVYYLTQLSKNQEIDKLKIIKRVVLNVEELKKQVQVSEILQEYHPKEFQQNQLLQQVLGSFKPFFLKEDNTLVIREFLEFILQFFQILQFSNKGLEVKDLTVKLRSRYLLHFPEQRNFVSENLTRHLINVFLEAYIIYEDQDQKVRLSNDYQQNILCGKFRQLIEKY